MNSNKSFQSVADDGSPLELKEGIVVDDDLHSTQAQKVRAHPVYCVSGTPGRWFNIILLPILGVGVMIMFGGIIAIALVLGLVFLFLRTLFGSRSRRL